MQQLTDISFQSESAQHLSLEAHDSPSHKQMMDRPEFAALVFKELKASQQSCLDVSTAYGRWILNCLFLMHGGALFGMFTFLGPVAREPAKIALYASTIWWFVIGLICALISGLNAWLNWGFNALEYENRANYRMLWEPSVWENEPIHSRKIEITNWLCIGFGVASALCIVGAADAIVNRIGFGSWTEILVASRGV